MKSALTAIVLSTLAVAAGCATPPDDASTEASSAIDRTDPQPDPTTDPGPIQELSLDQNTDWTVRIPGATKTVRVVAYGDSIFAGYNRSFFSVARRAAPLVAGEYLGLSLGANVQVVRRTTSGAIASEVYDNVVGDKSYMQDASTRAVYFEMCGNDYLQARDAFKSASGTCNVSKLDAALATCATNMEKAMTVVNASAPSAATRVIMNLYYPGFAADDVDSRCTDAATGQKANIQDTLLPYMAHSNWRACTLARSHGFRCADAFAELMGADIDTNGDGKVDAVGLRFDPAESEADYVRRITVTLRSTLKDANYKQLTASTTADYIYTDDTHPTYYGDTIGTGSGSGPADFTASQVVNGKNPQWNLSGHERLGWTIAQSRP